MRRLLTGLSLLSLGVLPAQAQYRDPITPTQLRQAQLLVQERACYDPRMQFCELTTRLQNNQLVVGGKVGDSEQKLLTLAGFYQLGYPVQDRLEVFPFKELSNPYAQVQVAAIDGHDAPSGQRLTQYIYGSYLRVLKLQGEWALVQSTQDQYISWIRYSEVIALSAERYENLAASFDSIVVKVKSATLYKDESLQTVIGQIPLGARLPLLAETETAFQVAYPGQREPQPGYLAKSETRLFVPLQGEGPEALLESARLYGLTPWLTGGATVAGWDSAAFIQTLYRLQGVLLPRESQQQQRMTLQIRNPEQTRPGDLVFYQHQTGIMLGGKRFLYLPINAPQAVIARLDSDKYAEALRTGQLSFGRVTPQSHL
jgi:cell wall-associated NlpC family hydrolase